MAGGKEGSKDGAMAAHLKAMGIWHGKRRTSPNANSGGTTMRMGTVGSAAYQRLMLRRMTGGRR